MSAQADVRRLREALRKVEARARTLPWAGRPGDGDTWTAADYVRVEDGLPTVDLHDLDRELAREAVTTALDLRGLVGPELRLITGRGRHSDGGKAVLRDAVSAQLRDAGVPYSAEAPGHLDVRLVATPTNRAWSIFLTLLRTLLAIFVRRG